MYIIYSKIRHSREQETFDLIGHLLPIIEIILSKHIKTNDQTTLESEGRDLQIN